MSTFFFLALGRNLLNTPQMTPAAIGFHPCPVGKVKPAKGEATARAPDDPFAEYQRETRCRQFGNFTRQ